MSSLPDLTELPSHHFLRRRARERQREYQGAYQSMRFRVVSAVRGPFGWRVERVVTKTAPSRPVS